MTDEPCGVTASLHGVQERVQHCACNAWQNNAQRVCAAKGRSCSPVRYFLPNCFTSLFKVDDTFSTVGGWARSMPTNTQLATDSSPETS